MANHAGSRAERYLRFTRGSMVLTLVVILVLGAWCLAMAFAADGGAPWGSRLGWILPIGMPIAFGILQRTTLRGERWDPKAPEARVILRDEWRRANMDRAMRVALIVVLVAQVPLGLAFTQIPTLRALMAMAAATTTLGMATVIACFLYFDRDARDAG